MRRAALIALLVAARSALAQPAQPAPRAASARDPAPGAADLAPIAGGPDGTRPSRDGAASLESPPASPTPAQPRRWFAIPVLSYLPETGLGGGASAGLHLHVEGAARPTSLFATALYTTERQGLLDLAVDSTLPGGTVLGARARALHYPDRFYGIGPQTQAWQMEHFTRRSVELVASAEFPVPFLPGVRVGPRLDLRAEQITDKDPGGQLAAGAVPGANGSSSVAGGVSATWDTRDQPFWPSRGSLVQAWYVYAAEGMARNGAFGRGVLELRHFAPLGGGRVLGLHAYGERASGEVPFTLLPRLGNTRFLRGIREGRYRDDVVWALQSELRSPLWWRISGVAFAAVGDVAPRLDAIRIADPKVAGGAGLRYRLTDEGANVRVDVAMSRFGTQLYVLVLEAF
jgi:hypothetical protein